MKKLIILIFVLPLFAIAQNQDTIFLKDGTFSSCTIYKKTDSVLFYSRTVNGKNYTSKVSIGLVKNYSLGGELSVDLNKSDRKINKDTAVKFGNIDTLKTLFFQYDKLSKGFDLHQKNNVVSGYYIKMAAVNMVTGIVLSTISTGLLMGGAFTNKMGFYYSSLVFSVASFVCEICVPINLFKSAKFLLKE